MSWQHRITGSVVDELVKPLQTKYSINPNKLVPLKGILTVAYDYIQELVNRYGPTTPATQIADKYKSGHITKFLAQEGRLSPDKAEEEAKHMVAWLISRAKDQSAERSH